MKPIRPSKRFAFVAIAFMLVGTALAQQRMSDHDVEKTMGNLKDDAKKFCKTLDSCPRQEHDSQDFRRERC